MHVMWPVCACEWVIIYSIILYYYIIYSSKDAIWKIFESNKYVPLNIQVLIFLVFDEENHVI